VLLADRTRDFSASAFRLQGDIDAQELPDEHDHTRHGRSRIDVGGSRTQQLREQEVVMKTIMFDDREIQLLTAIVIDKDKEEALKFLTNVIWDRVKDNESKACGPKAV